MMAPAKVSVAASQLQQVAHAQAHQNSGAGYTYEIYQQDVHAMDMYTHLRHWLGFLTLLLGRPLLPDDYIFPHLSRNGNVEAFRECSHDKIQSLIDLFTQQAKVSLGPGKHYTTHCFRRGGAQYRFMYAPIGKRWSLSRIRWWGGWAKGEHVSATTSAKNQTGLMYFESLKGLCCLSDKSG